MSSYNRTTHAINLVNGKDDDLIRWLTSVPPGGRNAALKMVLRYGLELPQPEAVNSPLEKIAALTGEIQTLKATVETVAAVQRMPSLAAASLDPSHLVQRDQLEQLQQVLAGIQYRMSQLESLVTGVPAATVPIIQAAPELTDAELQQRAAKLKKAKW